MSWLLVVQPDSVQADALRETLRAHISEDVVVAESLDEALSLIDQRVPDVILLPPLIPVAVEDYLIAYLATIPGAGHIQILGLPRLERFNDAIQRINDAIQRFNDSVQHRARSLFPWRWRQEPRVVGTMGCDPTVFTQDVLTYLAGAKALKKEIELCSAYAAFSGRPERRSEPRFTNDEVPWISFVNFGGERAALINVSSRGALLRTHSRPDHHSLRRSYSNVQKPSRLTLELASNSEVHARGRVIRCVPLRTSARTQYEIAFSFDDSVGLHLPATLVPALSGTDNDGW